MSKRCSRVSSHPTPLTATRVRWLTRRIDHRAQLIPGQPVSDVRSTITKISVRTLYVWSDGDTAVFSKRARNCGRYVNGEYRFETLHGVSHWILDEPPDAIADLLLEWFAAHPI
ncbi:MAG TPA: alpha/beta hydrolase [Mycobacterium sp.]|nr:alpha/beta hydrolase [Mycobacterium sp.]